MQESKEEKKHTLSGGCKKNPLSAKIAVTLTGLITDF